MGLQAASSEVFLVTTDVVSLYTDTPHGEGLEALWHFLDLRASQVPPTKSMASVANLALTRNNNNQFYLHSHCVYGLQFWSWFC